MKYLFFSILIFLYCSVSVFASKVKSFDAVISIAKLNLYQVNSSPLKNLNWIETENCFKVFIRSTVMIHLNNSDLDFSTGKIFFSEIDDDFETNKTSSCNMIAFYNEYKE